MRLGSCIALELAVAVGAVGGIWLGVGHAVEHAGDYFASREASAATMPSFTHSLPGRLPTAQLVIEPSAAPSGIFPASDDALLAPLVAPLVRVKPNNKGTSLSIRVDFASGARASFKPEQVHPQSDPRREVAAYRIDRMLGIGHVPPAKPIKFSLAEVMAAADPQVRTYTQARITEEAIARGTELRGMVSWWIPEIRDARMGKYRVDEPEAMAQWLGYLQIGAIIPPERRRLVEQLATVVVFDVIIDNADRWTGSNTKSSPDNQTLYFMDNTLSFSRFTRGHDNNVGPLRRMQVFSRTLIERLRGLSIESVTQALSLGDDPAGLGRLLSDEELRAVIARRDLVLEHVDRLIEKHGQEAVLALP